MWFDLDSTNANGHKMTLDAGTYVVTAWGTVQTCACDKAPSNPCDLPVQADGVLPASRCGYRTYGQPMMSLFAAVGSPCTNFLINCGIYIGKRNTLTVKEATTVYFKVADTRYDDNVGTLSVNVHRAGSPYPTTAATTTT